MPVPLVREALERLSRVAGFQPLDDGDGLRVRQHHPGHPAEPLAQPAKLVHLRLKRKVLQEYRHVAALHARDARLVRVRPARSRGGFQSARVHPRGGELVLGVGDDLRLAERHSYSHVVFAALEEVSLADPVLGRDGRRDGVLAHEQGVPSRAVGARVPLEPLLATPFEIFIPRAVSVVEIFTVVCSGRAPRGQEVDESALEDAPVERFHRPRCVLRQGVGHVRESLAPLRGLIGEDEHPGEGAVRGEMRGELLLGGGEREVADEQAAGLGDRLHVLRGDLLDLRLVVLLRLVGRLGFLVGGGRVSLLSPFLALLVLVLLVLALLVL
mmetsp:Transcript_11834/g.49729  ORF Transcript_11834/g.49729 Transcript_11834/m.49729 type:complete len:327 (+) Transcript_11834:193-1173(+)